MTGAVDEHRHVGVGQAIAGGTAVVAFGFLIYSLQSVLNPFLLFLALTSAMLPLRRTVWFWPIIGAGAGLTLFWLLSELGFLLAPFVLGLVLAYILNPLVNWIARRAVLARIDRGRDDRMRSRSVAILVLLLPLLGLIVLGALWGVPYLAQQVEEVLRDVPALIDRVAAFIQSLEERLRNLRIPGVEGSDWVNRIGDVDEQDVVRFLEERGESLIGGLWGGAIGLGRGIASVLSILGYLVLTPVLAFYLLRDYGRLGREVDSLIPPRKQSIREFLQEYDELLSGFLRGQLTVAFLVGSLTGIGLLITGFPYAILLGFLVAILGVIPYLGLVLSLIPAIAIALASGEPGISLLKLAVVFGITQTLEGTVISPRILGDSTGLHPVWILLAISLGGFFFGFVGLLIAVPAAVGVKLLVVRAVRRYRETAFFRPDGPDPEESAPT